MTILIVEQYLDFVREFCQQFYIMNRGEIVADGETSALNENMISGSTLAFSMSRINSSAGRHGELKLSFAQQERSDCDGGEFLSGPVAGDEAALRRSRVVLVYTC